MNFFRIFRRRQQREPKPLRIEGVTTEMTARPDDAETAATALLETLSAGSSRKGRKPKGKADGKGSTDRVGEKAPAHGASFYRDLSEKIRESREEERLLAVRYLAYCEEQLGKEKANEGELTELEKELYRLQDVAEREGGELKSRWQRCLAECIVGQLREEGRCG